MLNKEYKTLYPSIVPKNSIGKCVDIVNAYVYALKIEFKNGETLWFMKRDLKEVGG
ncbi:hypothetical protein [Carnobacterium maltaromaticum]|uniref:hypothetical protein n=1 Tax=Carnobacterium maltaromaticum TaxID=2751 RepID=UPI0018CEE374|nr:hypothetical protein [Carnobacterium maltaromaticum]